MDSIMAGMPQVDPRFIKNQGLPSYDQENYIPDDIMLALSHSPQPRENLAPLKHRALGISEGPPKKPAANVWSHKRREKFKHLTDSTTCKCGAGRDISFLYDVPLPKKQAPPSGKHDMSVVRDESAEYAEHMQFPRTLIPEEYHLVKNKGVLGLEYHDDDYTVYTQDHEHHLVVFPSMKPSSRYEVMKLKQSMTQMMDKVGVNDEVAELKGPTQIHNLLELIKKEQNIYNVIFHELIRQCSVDCVERGELLSDLRTKYNSLLSKVPIQIKGLHDEVLAQRALDRRLTEELLRFKSAISLLTNELALVKAHDCKVTLEADEAQRELKNALQEAARNASLLQEYHDLYELQRTRLEKSVDVLTEEKEMWCGAAYSLAIKVTEESQLGSARKLHVVEKSWTKLANHFTILLSDQDTEVVAQLQGDVDKFRNKIADFNLALLHREEEMRESVKTIIAGIEGWKTDYKNTCLNKDGATIACPTVLRQKAMLKEVHIWQETLLQLSEKFVGDQTCSSEDELAQIRRLMESWTDQAIKLFNRHRKEDLEENTNQENMMSVNTYVIELISQYTIRLTGENGVAKGVILMANMLETWETKLNLSIRANNPIPDTHWSSLQIMLDEWKVDMKAVLSCIGRGVKDGEDTEEDTKLDAHVIVRKVQKWATTSMTSIDSENAKLVEQVSSLHNEMVYWMIQMLLRLAPNFEGNSEEINNVALLASDSVANLESKAYKLFERLTIFSKYVSLCCDSIVRENVQLRQERMDEAPDMELKDLRRLRMECADWVHTAKILLCRLTGESEPEAISMFSSQVDEYAELVVPTSAQGQRRPEVVFAEQIDELDSKSESGRKTPVSAKSSSTHKCLDAGKSVVSMKSMVSRKSAVSGKSVVSTASADQMEYIGIDENTHIQPVEAETPDNIAVVSATKLVAQNRPVTPNTKRAFEALAAMSNLQEKLVEAERRAFEAEERATVAEALIVQHEEELRALKQVSLSGPDVTPASSGGSKVNVTASSGSKVKVTASQKASQSHTFVTQRETVEPSSAPEENAASSAIVENAESSATVAANQSGATKGPSSKKKLHKKLTDK